MADKKVKITKKAVVPELPFNAEAEKVVLGSAMLRKDFLMEVVYSLQESDFFVGKHQLIYRVIVELGINRNVPVDVLAVAEELNNLKELENCGGADYLGECTKEVVAVSSLKHYIGIVQDNAVLRNMLVAVRNIDSGYRNSEIENINDFILNSENEFKESIARRHVSSFSKTADIAPEIKSNLEILQSVNDSKDSDVIGITTGYEKLNHMTQGFQPGQLIIIAARPAVGKTALALNMALRIATREKKAVAFFSLEMSKEQLFNRLLAISSHVNSKDINSGRFRTANDYAKVNSAIKELSGCKIYIDDTPNIKLNDIVAKSNKLAATEPDLGLIVIDYLGLVQIANKGRNADSRQEEVRKISLALKALARDLGIPVIAVSQLSRAVEGRDSKRPMMSDLRDSGNIEQDADIVILLYRGDYYESSRKEGANNLANKKGGQLNSEDKYQLAKQKKEEELGTQIPGNVSYTELILAKNRSGQTGIVRLFFCKDYLKFDEPSREWEEAINKIANEE